MTLSARVGGLAPTTRGSRLGYEAIRQKQAVQSTAVSRILCAVWSRAGG